VGKVERIVLDTDTAIDLLRGTENTVNTIKKLEKDNILATTDITAFELYYGAYLSKRNKENVLATKQLLKKLVLLSTSHDSMENAGLIMANLKEKGEILDVKDVLIAAICLTNQCKILTKNKRHFQRIHGKLILENE